MKGALLTDEYGWFMFANSLLSKSNVDKANGSLFRELLGGYLN